MSSVDCPGAAAYADNLETLSSTVDCITRQHSTIQEFLRWTGMLANALKVSTMSVQRNIRGLHKTLDVELQLDIIPIHALSATDSYKCLGIGDGFDHVRRRVKLDAMDLLQSEFAPWQVVKAV
uniref:Uncharacterized protein n=1 Tax=Peronospora matthiolae TaxID=2874970 RepID=A0AAV1T7F5_9STRA